MNPLLGWVFVSQLIMKSRPVFIKHELMFCFLCALQKNLSSEEQKLYTQKLSNVEVAYSLLSVSFQLKERNKSSF